MNKKFPGVPLSGALTTVLWAAAALMPGTASAQEP